ncbi:MAG TPA: MBL fold metallo-hydrolase [Candidatus Magasanikbacteria bacterium]|nr:MBL fold metallo-hydrolase [Candidatus Magasanikbacteria bacterium]HBX16230.1 MBL fold metallo-hydrolase [Candidatus Magasanikbacteria bacterium]
MVGDDFSVCGFDLDYVEIQASSKFMKKKLFVAIIFVAVSVIGLFFYRQPVKIATPPIFSSSKIATSSLRVIFFDVGQGDSALIITPQDKTILVDGGPDDKVLTKLGKYLPLSQKKIDYMILTHPHADHLDGLVSVLKRYDVGVVYYSGVAHTTYSFLEWLKLIKEKNITMKTIDKPQVLELDSGIKLDFLYPNKDLSGIEIKGQEESKFAKINNLNNVSIIFKLIYGRTKFLFTGDAETPVEEELLKDKADLRADVLKVAHHGSHSSTNDKFLKAVQPQMAVISSGLGNDFGHPHLRTLRRLERNSVKIFRTDTDGDVEMASDGEAIK